MSKRRLTFSIEDWYYTIGMKSLRLSKLDSKTPISIIFGGNGFVGLHLTQKLKSLGHYVIVCDLNISQDNPANEGFTLDVKNPISLDLPKKPDYVFNLAAVHRTPGHSDKEYYETNISGAINITNWCEQVGADKIIFTSSIAVYGLQNGLINESSQPSPVSPYGYSKLFAEEIHKSWQAKSPLIRRIVIVRPAVIFGPGENGNFTRLARALKHGYFVIPSGRDVLKPSGWVGDLINSMLFCLNQKEQVLIYNFSFPETYSIGEVCEAFESVCKVRKAKVIPLGRILHAFRLPIKSYRQIVSRVEKLSNSIQIAPDYLLENGFVWEHNLLSSLEEWKNTNSIDEVFDREL